MSGLLALPMTPAQCYEGVIIPAFHELLPGKYWSQDAAAMLLAIAMQETDLKYRDQRDPRNAIGPARGLWEFEQSGAVRELLNNPATRLEVRAICLKRGVAPTERDIFLALGHDDLFACALARLLLWTNPARLPRIGQGDSGAAARIYRDTWRPGAWARDPDGLEAKFRRNYLAACKVVRPL